MYKATLQVYSLFSICMSDGFEVQWKNMLYDAGKRLVKLLLSKSEILIDKMEREENEVIISIYDGNLEEK